MASKLLLKRINQLLYHLYYPFHKKSSTSTDTVNLPQAAQVFFVLKSAYQRRLCSSARNKMIPHSMQRIILGSKACLLHDCPLLSLERLSLGNSELPKSCQTRYGIFCKRPALHAKDHSCQQSMPSAWLSFAVFGKVVSPQLRYPKKTHAKLYTVVSVDSAACGFFPAGSGVLSTDVLSTDVLSTAGPWNMPPCSRQ